MDGAANTTYTVSSFSYNETDQVTFQTVSSGGSDKTFAITNNLTKDGTGNLLFNANSGGANLIMTVGGNIVVNSGTLTFGASDRNLTSLTVSGTTSIGSGATLRARNSTQRYGVTVLDGQFQLFNGSGITQSIYFTGLSGAGSISVPTDTSSAQTATIRFDQSSGTSTYSGNISQGTTNAVYAISMEGAGKQILSGSNSYSGNTTLTAGVLRAESHASVLGTGTVSFSGVGGTLELANDTGLNFGRNTLLGGSIAGTITVDRLTAGAGVTLQWEISP